MRVGRGTFVVFRVNLFTEDSVREKEREIETYAEGKYCIEKALFRIDRYACAISSPCKKRPSNFYLCRQSRLNSRKFFLEHSLRPISWLNTTLVIPTFFLKIILWDNWTKYKLYVFLRDQWRYTILHSEVYLGMCELENLLSSSIHVYNNINYINSINIILHSYQFVQDSWRTASIGIAKIQMHSFSNPKNI